MTTYVWDKTKQRLVPKDEYQRPQSHYIISDSMTALKNHADGNIYESKSAFRKATRNAGCVEIGNDTPILPRETRGDFNVRQELKQALSKIMG